MTPVRTVDYHTAGEPFRIALDGIPEITGQSVAERRLAATAPEVDAVRRLLCHEPRGHSDMYGCFLLPGDDPGAHFGVLFWHKDGYSTACGHGTIALGAWAVESGRVTADPDGETDVVMDVPSGRVTARVLCRTGVVESITFRNVPSYVVARGVQAGEVSVDLAYGGAIYASIPARAVGLQVRPEDLTGLVAAARRVKAELVGHAATRHPSDDRLSGVYGVIFYEEFGPEHQRNVTVFADGEVDRSPCGSGTAARLALLHADGFTGTLVHDSIVGSRFHGRVAEVVQAEGRTAIVPEIKGMAYRTGEHTFTLDRRDPMGTGFTLR